MLFSLLALPLVALGQAPTNVDLTVHNGDKIRSDYELRKLKEQKDYMNQEDTGAKLRAALVNSIVVPILNQEQHPSTSGISPREAYGQGFGDAEKLWASKFNTRQKEWEDFLERHDRALRLEVGQQADSGWKKVVDQSNAIFTQKLCEKDRSQDRHTSEIYDLKIELEYLKFQLSKMKAQAK